MANITAISTRSPDLPPVQTPAQRRVVAALTSGATTDGGVMTLLPGKEISPDERRGMEARLLTLRQCLDQRDRRATEAIIAAFLTSYGSSRGSETDAKIVVGTYASVLADIPPWAVAEAARAWTRGGYGAVASAFAPSAAQFYECAARIIRNYSREADDITALLGAKTQPIPADERKRVAAGFDRLVSDLGGKPVTSEASARLRYEALCEEMGVDPNSVPDAKPTIGAKFTMTI